MRRSGGDAKGELEEIMARTPDVDRAKVEGTTDDEIRQQAREDREDPGGAEEGWLRVPPPRDVRRELDLTQEEFAAAIRVPIATIRNWEQGRTLPDPAARTLLALIAADPAHAVKLLGLPSSRPAGGRSRTGRFA